MHYPSKSARPFGLNVSLVLAALLLAGLWIAGGASRADVIGQAICRLLACIVLAAFTLFGPRGEFRRLGDHRAVLVILLGCIALPLIQLIPLPPTWWLALPHRAPLTDAATLTGQPQPWRPWSIVPATTFNAACSLLVPLTTFCLVATLAPRDHIWLLRLLLALVVASMLVGLVQFSGVDIDNPFINGPGEVNGMFANHNHFALFIAFGCLLAPAWAFEREDTPRWRAPVALGLVVLFILTILASGSRAGMAAGVIGLGCGLVMIRTDVKRALRRYPRWVFPALISGTFVVIGALVMLSIAADRAMSINRAISVDISQDMRSRGLPIVLAMINDYFPAGSGLGSFDPIFRMHEPFALLKPTYFNHAHDDFLEILLDAGLPGLLLLLTALAWWTWASVRAWRAGPEQEHRLARLGSVVLVLVFGASIVDYPARTPMVMAVIVIAAIWLSGHTKHLGTSALRAAPAHL